MSRDQKLNVEAADSPSAVQWISDFGQCMCTVEGASRDISVALKSSLTLTHASTSLRCSVCVTSSVTCRAAVRPWGQWESAKCRLSCMKATFKQQLIPDPGQFKGAAQLVFFNCIFYFKKKKFFLTAESNSCLQCGLFCPIQQSNRHSSMAWICHQCSSWRLCIDLGCRKFTEQKGPAHKIMLNYYLSSVEEQVMERATIP